MGSADPAIGSAVRIGHIYPPVKSLVHNKLIKESLLISDLWGYGATGFWGTNQDD